MKRVLPYRSAEDRAAAHDALARHFADDGLVAYPTETVYGLGCVLRPRALARLAAFKRDRPFLLLVPGPDALPDLRWTPAARRLADRFWPGPLTLALDAPAGAFPSEVVGPDGAVAVRVSSHPAVSGILEAARGPVTSTSANAPGDPPARDADAARRAAESLAGPDSAEFLILDGGTLPPAAPSTIVRCGAVVRVLREGALAQSEIEATLEPE